MKQYRLKKMNEEPLVLDSEFVNKDDEESSLFFEYDDVHHYLSEVISRRSNWFPKYAFDLPDFICGVDENDYYNPLFVEILEDIDYGEYGIAFNVYKLEVSDGEFISDQESEQS